MAVATILLIGNERAPSCTFANALRKRYEVVTASSGKEGLSLARAQQPHAVIVDAISMRTPGERICRLIRNRLKDVPIIHLHPGPKEQAHSEADVVLFPPFTSRKITNTVKRLVQASDDEIVRCGPFAINVDRRILSAHGEEIPLTPKLARLVETFLRHPGETLDRKTLMETIWNTDYLGDTRTLDVHIRWIRQAIESDAGKPSYLKTVRGVGYCLELPGEVTPTR